jgi:hypothetical protein
VHTLGDVLDQLDRWHQRATYGAVAGATGGTAQSLMRGRVPCPRDSWVVNARSKRPTGYAEADTHPALLERSHVISTPAELDAWMDEHRGPRRVPRAEPAA